MCKFKYLSVILFAAVLAGVFVVSCKDKDPDPKEEGIKAGTEMCGCVSSIDEPMIPYPPEGFNPSNPDLTDPATLEYLATVQNIYETYFTELGNCAGGVAGKYQKYFLFNIGNYDEAIGLFSAFDFIDKDFEAGFLGATQVCAEAFDFQ
jgi:hypothetical protein